MDQVDRILEQWARERPDLDTGPMGILGRIARLERLLMARIEEVHQKHGLNFASFDVLATLRRSGPPYALTPSALIEWTMVTSGTMTNRIDRLAAQGFIERRPNPEDGRGTIVALTDKGMAVIDEATTEHVANQHRVIAALDESDRADLNRVLAKWLDALGNEPAETAV